MSTVAQQALTTRARVLIIDDEPVVQDVLGRLLRKAGFEPASATSAREGLALLAEQDPHLVILDVMLPDQNGLEILRQIKDVDPERPVIMMTAYGSVDDAVAAMKQGDFHYLTKPFSND
jgi:DNA-binding NtrC family response regulator